jgi:hypothetical protein
MSFPKRLTSAVAATAFVFASFPAAQLSALSSRPNESANPLCPFGPGIARWAVKTSVPPGQPTTDFTDVKLDDLINAPDLEVDQATRAAMFRAYTATRAGAALAQPSPVLTARMRWASPSQPFTLSLPGVTPRLVAKAASIAQTVSDKGEMPPSAPFALLTAQLGGQRIPDPVTIGGRQLREGNFIRVSGVVLASTCEHDDGDFHVDLGDSANSDTCAVVEVPNSAYIEQQPLAAMIGAAEAKAKGLARGEDVSVIGQLFYDTAHGGTSSPGGGRGVGHCAQSLWEVHPVFAISISS